MGFLRRLWRGFKVNVLDRCECGGKWEYIGESGFLVCRIHEQCNGCGAERTFLLEH